MPDDTSTVVAGETPPATVTPPVTGTTPPSGSVTPPKTAADELEEFKAKYAALEKTQANAKDELERHRKNAKKLADYEQKEQAAREAAQSDVEKANTRAQAAEEQAKQLKQQLVDSQIKTAAMEKNFRNPNLVASAIRTQLEYGEDGLPTNLESVLDKLIKSDDYLVKPAEPAATTPPTQTTPPVIPAMNPGRSGFAPPSQTAPNKPFTLDQVQWKR